MVRIARWLLVATVGWVPLCLGCDPEVADPPDVMDDDGDDDASDDDAGDDDLADDDAGDDDTGDDDTGDDDTGDDDAGDDDTAAADAFADAVVSFTPGEGAGFGQQGMPAIVLGPPHGMGDGAGSLDVVSLGDEGEIVLEFIDLLVVDGPGVDLLVFENPFIGWFETGVVAVSDDGVTWHEFPCDAQDAVGGYPGCSGTHPVYSNPGNGLDPTDPAVAGGDPYDLADLGVAQARFVRVRDSGENVYGAPAGGYDLDAVAIVHGATIR